ncbi:excisionase family DNA-binding protein [Vibrio parahaemolyticus]|nr:excisionase family DNA-binding protein [Vibrio parahaemolyticus]
MNNYDFAASVSAKPFRLITKRELAERLNISVRTLYRMVERKEIKQPMRTPKGYIRGWQEQDLSNLFLKA